MRLVPDTLTHERTVAFVDYHNTVHALRREGRQIDLVALRDYLAEGRHLLEAFLYIATHPQADHQVADLAALHRLRQHGFLVRTRTGQLLPNGRLKCDFDPSGRASGRSLEMALDVQEFAARTRPDIAVRSSASSSSAAMATLLLSSSGCGSRAFASKWPPHPAASPPPCGP